MQSKVKLDDDFEVVVELKDEQRRGFRAPTVGVSIDGAPFTVAEREYMHRSQRYRVLVPWDNGLPRCHQRFVTVATKRDIVALAVSWFELRLAARGVRCE